MFSDTDWDKLHEGREGRAETARSGALRIALLFGAAVVAVALLAVPMLSGRSLVASNGSPGIDSMTTGTVATPGIYTLHQSVLQPTPRAVCVIHPDGKRSGDC
jgi:hypothetical protein